MSLGLAWSMVPKLETLSKAVPIFENVLDLSSDDDAKARNIRKNHNAFDDSCTLEVEYICPSLDKEHAASYAVLQGSL